MKNQEEINSQLNRLEADAHVMIENVRRLRALLHDNISSDTIIQSFLVSEVLRRRHIARFQLPKKPKK